MGGLSKKAFQIQSLSKQNSHNRLFLDSGNLIFKRNTITNGIEEKLLKAKSIIEIYQALDCDGVGVGPLDLAGGVDLLLESSNNGFPWISANIMDTAGKPLFKQWIEKTIQDTDIIITALTSPTNNIQKTLQIVAWKTVLPTVLSQIHKKKDNPFIILLSTLSNKENLSITKLYPTIHLLISADPSQGNMSPQLHNNCLITQTANKGKYQGLLEIHLGHVRKWGQNSAEQMRTLQNRRDGLNWQLRRTQKRAKANQEKYKSTISRITNEKEKIAGRIASLQETINREKKEGKSNDQYTYRFIGLKKHMPKDEKTVESLDQLSRAIRKISWQ